MRSEDLAANIAATREFVRGCSREAADGGGFEITLAFNMMVPPKVRGNLGGRPLDATEVMSQLKIPVLVTHGDEDRQRPSSVPPNTPRRRSRRQALGLSGRRPRAVLRRRRAFQYRVGSVRARSEQDELTLGCKKKERTAPSVRTEDREGRRLPVDAANSAGGRQIPMRNRVMTTRIAICMTPCMATA